MARWNNSAFDRDEQYRLKRQALIRQAGKVFSKDGFEGTSLDEIAKQLNVTKAALYYYVKSKHEILFECHQLAHDLSERAIEEAERDGRNGLEKLTLFLHKHIETLTGELGSIAVLTNLASLKPSDRAKIIARRDQFDAALRGIIKEGIDDGSLRPCDTKLTGFFIMGAINWIPTWFSDKGSKSGKEVADKFIELFVDGLRP